MDPKAFLPLTPVALEILMALSGGELHGYAVLTAVNENASRVVHPGTLYRAITRMVEQGMLMEDEAAPGERRRVYGLTDLGREVYGAEVGRLADQVRRAAAAASTGVARKA